LIWVKGPYNESLSLLSRKLNQIFKARHNKRKLIPHVTIARFRKDTPLEKIMKINKEIDISEKINGVSPIKSRLKREGAIHEGNCHIQ
jgi:2'-5' RNA ligase